MRNVCIIRERCIIFICQIGADNVAKRFPNAKVTNGTIRRGISAHNFHFIGINLGE